jgi:hypothetical protein
MPDENHLQLVPSLPPNPAEVAAPSADIPILNSTVNPLQVIGEAAVEPYVGIDSSINQATIQPRPRQEEPMTRVETIDTAEAMAKSSDDDRSMAVVDRKLAATSDITTNNLNPKLPSSDETDRVQPDRQSYQSRMLAEAHELDSRASKVEDWAQILVEKPISEEYKKLHEDISFTPKGMLFAEETLGLREESVQGHRLALEEYTSAPLSTLLVSELLEEYIWDKNLNAVISNELSTMKDLRELFIGLQQAKLTESKLRADEIRSVLEEVRSGLAGQNLAEKQ